jgi:hypothetical protein
MISHCRIPDVSILGQWAIWCDRVSFVILGEGSDCNFPYKWSTALFTVCYTNALCESVNVKTDTVFHWVVVPSSVLDMFQDVWGTCCMHYQCEGSSRLLWIICMHLPCFHAGACLGSWLSVTTVRISNLIWCHTWSIFITISKVEVFHWAVCEYW